MADLTADEWNACYPVGTPVVVQHGPAERRRTCTRTPSWPLGHGTPVVSVEGYSGGIALTHVTPIRGDDRG